MRLSEVIKTEKFKKLYGINDEIFIRASNIDDIFCIIRELNILEVSVELGVMLAISRFVGGNCGQTIYGSEAIRTGNVMDFLGVKLTLEI